MPDFFFLSVAPENECCQFSNSVPALRAPRPLRSHLTCVPSSGFCSTTFVWCLLEAAPRPLRWRALIVALQPL